MTNRAKEKINERINNLKKLSKTIERLPEVGTGINGIFGEDSYLFEEAEIVHNDITRRIGVFGYKNFDEPCIVYANPNQENYQEYHKHGFTRRTHLIPVLEIEKYTQLKSFEKNWKEKNNL